MAARLLLVRHCEATGQEPGAPLTPRGVRESWALADFLAAYPVDAIVTSAYLRARQTADPLAELRRLETVVDPRLNERNLSPSPIENWQQVLRDSFANLDLRAPGGESANDVLRRAWPALAALLCSTCDLPVVVTHGNLLALVLHSVDPAFGYAGWERLSNPDVYELNLADDGAKVFRRLWAPPLGG